HSRELPDAVWSLGNASAAPDSGQQNDVNAAATLAGLVIDRAVLAEAFDKQPRPPPQAQEVDDRPGPPSGQLLVVLRATEAVRVSEHADRADVGLDLRQ